MLKKFVSIIVGTAMACAALGVSADISVSTTSTYNSTAPGTIRVTSYVSGAAAGDILTYLAYGKNGKIPNLSQLQGKDIVYIDQKEVQAGDIDTEKGVPFTYVTDTANIQAAVKAGGVVSGAAQIPGDGKIEGPSCQVTVNSGSPVSVPYGDKGFVKVACAISADVTAVEIDNQPLAAEKWFTAVDGIWVDAAQFEGKNEVRMTVKFGSVTAVSAQTLALGYMAADTDGVAGAEGKKSIIALGKLEGTSADYGILFGATAEAVAAHSGNFSEANGNAYPALGVGSDGKFAVKMYDYDTAGFGDGNATTAYARAYWKTGGDTYEYGEVYQVGIGGATNVTGTKLPAANEANQLSLAAEMEEAVVELPAAGQAEAPAEPEENGTDAKPADGTGNDQTAEPEPPVVTLPAEPDAGRSEAPSDAESGISTDKTGEDSEENVENNGSAQ